MNVSIYKCGLKIVDILSAFCVFKSLKTTLNKRNNPIYYETHSACIKTFVWNRIVLEVLSWIPRELYIGVRGSWMAV